LRVEIKLRDDDSALEQAIRLVESSPKLSQKNKEIILSLKDELSCSKARLRKYLQQWRFLGEWLGKDFTEASEKDIKRLVNIIRSKYPDDLPNGKVRAKTRRDYKQALKLLYTLLEGEDGIPPKKVAWIKTGIPKKFRTPRIRMLTVEERIWLIESAKYLRDKAMVACLCDGLRPDELLYMRVGDVHVAKDGTAWAIVRGYKGTRRVDFIWGTPFLLQWIEHHPFKHNPFSPMWVHLRAKSERDYIKYKRFEKIMKQVGERAQKIYGLSLERVWAYLFRHVRATELAQYLTDAQMDEYFGWEKGSPMPQIYVHLSGKAVGNKVKKIAGIEVEEEDEETFKLKRCPVCKRVNPQHYERCYHCGEALDEKTIYEKKQEAILRLQNLLVENPELFVALQELAKNK